MTDSNQANAAAGGRRQSNYPVKTTIADAASLTYFEQGVNFSITFGDFINALGVTGTIVQAGDPTGVPVLDTQGTVNNIRNIEASFGITAAVSALNGITLKSSFAADTVGVPVLDLSGADPLVRSIKPGSGITVTQDGDGVLIAVGASVSTKTVLISQASDFPAPVAGVIQLVANTDYFIINDVSVSDRFALADKVQLRGVSTVIVTLTYTGTGSMFTDEDADVRMRNMTVAASSGTLFEITSSTTAGVGTVFCANVVFIADKGGNIHCNIFALNSIAVILTTDGFKTTGATMDVFSVVDATWIQFAGIGTDYGATVFRTLQSKNMFLTLSAGVDYISGLANSGNLASNGLGAVIDNRFTGAGNELVNITPDDDRWAFLGNNTIRNTIRDSIVSVQGNATETVITTINTAVKAAATFTVGRSSGFTGDTTGRITYNLANDIVIPMTASLTVLMASGGSSDVTAYVAVNGTIVAESAIGTDSSSSVGGNISLTWQEELTTSDFIEIFLENNSGTVNIILVDAIFRAQ